MTKSNKIKGAEDIPWIDSAGTVRKVRDQPADVSEDRIWGAEAECPCSDTPAEIVPEGY